VKLDEVFAREVKKTANGDGSREDRFSFLKKAREAAGKMSSPNVMREFDSILREYGRATVGLCVAVTIWERRGRLSRKSVYWAIEVLKLWTNRPADPLTLYIGDNLHPSRIEEYAGELVRNTSLDG